MSRNTIVYISFLVLYAGIALAGIAVWLLFPTAAMISFLAISTVHFGRSDVAKANFKLPMLSIFARGGLWTISLPLIHWQITSVFFDYLLTDLRMMHIGLIIAVIPWSIASAAHLVIEFRQNNRRICCEWLLALLLVIFLPHLWALCLYFCGWHASRHMFRVFFSTKNTRGAVTDMLLFTAITFAIAAAVYFLYARNIELTSAAIVIFFVGLFELTVPHMVLIDTFLPLKHKHWRIDV